MKMTGKLLKKLIYDILTGFSLWGVISCETVPEWRIHYPQRLPGDTPTIIQEARNIPVIYQADVIIAGGGIAGVAAALRAAADGMSVVIIEERNCFGYEFVSSLRCSTAPYKSAPSYEIAEKLCHTFITEEIYKDRMINPTALQFTLQRLVEQESTVKVYLYSRASGAVMEGNRVRGVVMTNRSGRQVVLGNVIIDATDDARIAACAGARFIRDLAGEKTVRSYIQLLEHDFLKTGIMNIPSDIDLLNDNIIVHAAGRNKYIELVFRTAIGDNIARDWSRAQAGALEKGMLLMNHFGKHLKGFKDRRIDEDGRMKDNFLFGTEILIDEAPVVMCRSPLGSHEAASLSYDNADAFLPEGIEGLVMAGRTISTIPEVSDLQALLCSGEQSGKTAVLLAEQMQTCFHSNKQTEASKETEIETRVRELLHGPDISAAYPVIYESPAALPTVDKVDVLVVGGGTSGAPAAIAAARQGVTVALIEFLPNLGGTGTHGVSYYYWGTRRRSTLQQDIDKNLSLFMNSPEVFGFSGEKKKAALQELILKEGVTLYYCSLGAGVVMDGSMVTGVVMENVNGRQVIPAKIVIDATGHGDLAAAAGAAFTKGRESDGIFNEMMGAGLRDPTNVEDISAFFMKNPSESIHLNVRESRHVIGDYVLTFKDIIEGRGFSDVVCMWRSGHDTHFPHTANQSTLVQNWAGILGLRMKPLGGGIPYRCLLPKGLDNLLVAGKSISLDHDAQQALRMQRDLQYVGEVSGIAAATAVKLNTSPRLVPIRQLQEELVEAGVLHREDVMAVEKTPRIYDSELAIKDLGTNNALDAMCALYLAGQQYVPVLKQKLSSKNYDVRIQAALILGMLEEKSAMPVLLELLKNRDNKSFRYTLPGYPGRESVPVYYAAVILLGRMQVKESVPFMMDILKDREHCPPALASFTIKALGEIGDASAVEAIKPYLTAGKSAPVTNENVDFEMKWGVRTQAAKALAGLGDYSGVPVLIELLDDNLSLIRDYAERILIEITGRQLGKDREKWMEWWNKHRS